jgi:hypothetical protein
MAHVTWTGCAAYHWNGQTHVLSAINAKTRVAQRLYVRLRPLAYAARSRPRGSIGSLPGRGAGVYAIRSGSYQIRSGHVSAPDPRLGPDYGPSVLCPGALGPHCGRPRTHTGGSGSHSRGPVRTHGGPGPDLEAWTVYAGVRYSPMGVRTHC